MKNLFLIVFFIPIVINSQKIESIHLDSAKFYLRTNQSKAEKHILRALDEAEEGSDRYYLAEVYKNYAIILGLTREDKNYEKAIIYSSKALKIYKELGETQKAARVKNNLIHLYNHAGMWPKSLEIAYSVLSDLKRENDTLAIASVYGGLGNIYFKTNLLDSSLVNFNKAYKLFKSQENPKQFSCIYMVGLIEMENGNNLAAIDYFLESYEGLRKSNNTYDLLMTLNKLGTASARLKLYDEAKNYFKLSKGITDSIKNTYYQTRNNQYLIELNLVQNKISDSLLNLINDTNDTIIKYQYDRLEPIILRLKSDYYLKKGDSLMSYKYFRKASELSDSLDVDITPELTQLIIKKSLQKAQQNNSILSEKIKYSKYVYYIIIVFIALLAIFIYVMIRKQQNDNSRLKRKNLVLENALKELEVEKNLILKNSTTNKVLTADLFELLKKINHFHLRLKNSDEINAKNVRVIKLLQQEVKHKLNLEESWDDYFIQYTKLHPNMMNYLLTNFELSSTELKICTLIIMNLSNKEICTIANLSVNSIHTTLSRLKKKMDLPKNKSLKQYLYDLEYRYAG